MKICLPFQDCLCITNAHIGNTVDVSEIQWKPVDVATIPLFIIDASVVQLGPMLLDVSFHGFHGHGRACLLNKFYKMAPRLFQFLKKARPDSRRKDWLTKGSRNRGGIVSHSQYTFAFMKNELLQKDSSESSTSDFTKAIRAKSFWVEKLLGLPHHIIYII